MKQSPVHSKLAQMQLCLVGAIEVMISNPPCASRHSSCCSSAALESRAGAQLALLLDSGALLLAGTCAPQQTLPVRVETGRPQGQLPCQQRLQSCKTWLSVRRTLWPPATWLRQEMGRKVGCAARDEPNREHVSHLFSADIAGALWVGSEPVCSCIGWRTSMGKFLSAEEVIKIFVVCS